MSKLKVISTESSDGRPLPTEAAKDEFIRKVIASDSTLHELRAEAAKLLPPEAPCKKLDRLKKQKRVLAVRAKRLGRHQVNGILEAVAGQWDGTMPTGGMVSSCGVHTNYGTYRVDISKGAVVITEVSKHP